MLRQISQVIQTRRLSIRLHACQSVGVMNNTGVSWRPHRRADSSILPQSSRANQLFKLGNNICRGMGILPVFFGHGQDARAT